MNLIDSHCHLDFKQFDSDRKKVLHHCQNLNVSKIIVPAVTAARWSILLHICQSSEMLYPVLGLHPMFMAEHKPEHLDQLKQQIQQHPIIAIGEIGLDFYLPDHDKDAQIELFKQQLAIAQHANLPVLLHVRKAHDQTISLLKQTPVTAGIVHAFNGSLQQAKQYIDLGFVLGVGGAITHSNATRLRALITALPLSSLVLETDAPDMPLSEQQGQRNTPENIPKILDILTELRTEDRQTIASVTTNNCHRVLHLSDSTHADK